MKTSTPPERFLPDSGYLPAGICLSRKPHGHILVHNNKLNEIYKAALQTFRQNTVDVFMDCPSRERAGWLCDSYFTAIMEKEFTGYSCGSAQFLREFRSCPKILLIFPKVCSQCVIRPIITTAHLSRTGRCGSSSRLTIMPVAEAIRHLLQS